MEITKFYVFYTFNNKLQNKTILLGLYQTDLYQTVILFMLLHYY